MSSAFAAAADAGKAHHRADVVRPWVRPAISYAMSRNRLLDADGDDRRVMGCWSLFDACLRKRPVSRRSIGGKNAISLAPAIAVPA